MGSVRAQNKPCVCLKSPCIWEESWWRESHVSDWNPVQSARVVTRMRGHWGFSFGVLVWGWNPPYAVYSQSWHSGGSPCCLRTEIIHMIRQVLALGNTMSSISTVFLVVDTLVVLGHVEFNCFASWPAFSCNSNLWSSQRKMNRWGERWWSL